MPEMIIAELANLPAGRLFYSGRLYIVESQGAVSKARPWGSPVGTTEGCVTLSPKGTLARFYPLIERAMVLPVFRREDFLVQGRPAVYVFKAEKDAQRAADLDRDLAAGSGLSVQRQSRLGAWLLTDGANPYRLYRHPAGATMETACAAFCAQHGFTEGMWPDDKTRHWPLLFG